MYWVTMTDTFMSRWGYARDKINKLVIECPTYEEAAIVALNAQDRSEMRYINICGRKPYYNAQRYHVSYHTLNECETWGRTDRPFRR